MELTATPNSACEWGEPEAQISRLTLHQRLQAKITAIESEQVERSELNCLRPRPVHMEPGKVWTPIGITRYNLAIEQNRFGWELVPQLPDARQALDESCPLRL